MNTAQPEREITIIKQDHLGNFVFSWQGRLLRTGTSQRVISAIFTPKPHQVGRVTFNPGDLFVENYSTRAWYNVFEVYEQQTGQLKAWYCNLSYPAVFRPAEILWRDLALDLLVYPDGSSSLLDQDEFASLNLSAELRKLCWQTVELLLQRIDRTSDPVFKPAFDWE